MLFDRFQAPSEATLNMRLFFTVHSANHLIAQPSPTSATESRAIRKHSPSRTTFAVVVSFLTSRSLFLWLGDDRDGGRQVHWDAARRRRVVRHRRQQHSVKNRAPTTGPDSRTDAVRLLQGLNDVARKSSSGKSASDGFGYLTSSIWWAGSALSKSGLLTPSRALLTRSHAVVIGEGMAAHDAPGQTRPSLTRTRSRQFRGVHLRAARPRDAARRAERDLCVRRQAAHAYGGADDAQGHPRELRPE